MDAVTATRTLADVQHDITIKRGMIVSAIGMVREAEESVRRRQALLSKLEAEMVALATEESEGRRLQQQAVVDKIPLDYQPAWYDPKREVDIESGVCGAPRPVHCAPSVS